MLYIWKNNQIEILQIRNKLTYLEIIDGFNSKLGTPTGRITKMEEKLEQTIQGINKTRGNTEERMRRIEHRVGKWGRWICTWIGPKKEKKKE